MHVHSSSCSCRTLYPIYVKRFSIIMYWNIFQIISLHERLLKYLNIEDYEIRFLDVKIDTHLCILKFCPENLCFCIFYVAMVT